MEGAQPPKPLEFIRAVHEANVRYLLIGRRAVIAYGGPVQTMDYDLFIDGSPSNTDRLLSIAEKFGLHPSRSRSELTNHFMFRLENSFVVDVLRASSLTNDEGNTLEFDELYERRTVLEDEDDFQVNVPMIDDLIELKKIDPDEQDRLDIKYLRRIRKQQTDQP